MLLYKKDNLLSKSADVRKSADLAAILFFCTVMIDLSYLSISRALFDDGMMEVSLVECRHPFIYLSET